MTNDLRERVLRLLEAAERYLEADDYHPRCTQCGSEWPAGKIVDGVWTQVSPLHKPDCELAAVLAELRRPEPKPPSTREMILQSITGLAQCPQCGRMWLTGHDPMHCSCGADIPARTEAPANAIEPGREIGPAWKVPPPEGGCGEPLLLDCDCCGGQMRLVHSEFCLCPSTGTPLYVQSHRCQ